METKAKFLTTKQMTLIALMLMAKCNNGEISREEAESQMINQY